MTETMLTTVNDLINRWTDIVHTDDRKKPYKPVDHDPLLVTLREAIRSSTGGTTSGASDDAARNMLNLEAFELWEQITADVAHLTRKHTKDRPNPLLGYAVKHIGERIDALWNTNQITETDREYAIRRAKAWRARIWGLLHKPREKDLDHCPECEHAKIVNADGEIQAALVAYYQQGTEPVAKCRHCGWVWEGEAQLIILGRRLGAAIDEEALAEMGVWVESQQRTEE